MKHPKEKGEDEEIPLVATSRQGVPVNQVVMSTSPIANFAGYDKFGS